MNNLLSKIDFLILCGGLGTRLRSAVPLLPKSMASINGKPFLDILLEYIASFGFRRIILCSGYKSELIEEHYNRSSKFKLLFSREYRPLGTAGAIKNAAPLIRSKDFFVANGDSFCPEDLSAFYRFHIKGRNFSTILLTSLDNKGEYGGVDCDRQGRIISFREKGSGGGYVNAGIYLLKKEILGLIPGESRVSLEYDIFPGLLKKRFYGYPTDCKLIDIGTPARYSKAKKIFGRGR